VIRNKALSPTWITNSPLPAKFGEMYIGILSRYNWKSVMLIVDLQGAAIHQYLAKAASVAISKANFKSTTWTFSSKRRDNEEIMTLLSGLREICRGTYYSKHKYFLFRNLSGKTAFFTYFVRD
jgi:hypothetical protein